MNLFDPANFAANLLTIPMASTGLAVLGFGIWILLIIRRSRLSRDFFVLSGSIAGWLLLQAIATAGGYTRIASARKITVQRTVGTENQLIKLDAEALALDKDKKPFEILPDDVIVIGEKWI